MKKSGDQTLDDLCAEVYHGDWKEFLDDLGQRSKSKSLPYKKRQNVQRDIVLIRQVLCRRGET